MKTHAALTATAMIASLSASGIAAEFQTDTSIDVRIRNYQ